MGIFNWRKRILNAPTAATTGVISPWAPADDMTRLIVDDVLAGQLKDRKTPLTREVALRIPAVKRAHSLIVGAVAAISLHAMTGETRAATDPEWLTASAAGVSPYHRMFGVCSDLFFHGWALLAFTKDRTDAIHVPYGMWAVMPDGSIEIDGGRTDTIPAAYHALPVAIPYGYGENGILTDAADTLAQARQIEAAYSDRLDNPVPLTVLTVVGDRWDSWTSEERTEFRKSWVNGRKSAEGSTAMKPDWVTVDMPGSVAVDLYETGRNGVRIDIANHVGLPVSMIEGVRQGGGGGGTEMRYSGVQNGAQRNEVWDYGSPRRMLSAIEARLSLDDVLEAGLSIRGDLTHVLTAPEPLTNPTSED